MKMKKRILALALVSVMAFAAPLSVCAADATTSDSTEEVPEGVAKGILGMQLYLYSMHQQRLGVNTLNTAYTTITAEPVYYISPRIPTTPILTCYHTGLGKIAMKALDTEEDPHGVSYALSLAKAAGIECESLTYATEFAMGLPSNWPLTGLEISFEGFKADQNYIILHYVELGKYWEVLETTNDEGTITASFKDDSSCVVYEIH